MQAEILQLPTTTHERHNIRRVFFTPDVARDWLMNYSFLGQRPTNAMHIAYMTRAMLQNDFDDGETIRCVAVRQSWVNDGAFYLVNGQHRLEAIIRSQTAQELIIVTTIVDDYHDIARIYARIDRGRHRSIGDIMRASDDYELYGLSPRAAGLVATAASIIEGRFSSSALYGTIYESRSADARRSMAINYAIPALRYLKAIDSADAATKRAFNRRVVMAVGIATYDGPESQARADEFWRIAALDDGLNRTDPRHQLWRFLYQMTGQNAVKQRNIGLRGVIECWNAYYEGRTLQAVRPNPAGPITILGTRFCDTSPE